MALHVALGFSATTHCLNDFPTWSKVEGRGGHRFAPTTQGGDDHTIVKDPWDARTDFRCHHEEFPQWWCIAILDACSTAK